MSTKIVRSERWSDLQAAARASARLVAAREPATAPRAGDGAVRWASLASGRSAPAAPSERPWAPEPGIDLAAIEAAGERGWNAWLAWACDAAPAEAAFVVDHHGLPVAAHGELLDADRETVATRLVMALEHAARLDDAEPGGEPAASVSIDWRGRVWAAIREGSLVLCMVSSEPIPRARLAHVAAAIGRAAAGLEA